MPAKNLEAQVRRSSGAAIIDLHGEIDGRSEEALMASFQQARAPGPAAILLNFSDVDYINSTGIALIVTLLAETRKDGCPLFAFGLSDHYLEIFGITRLVDYIGVYPDEESAISAACAVGPR